MSRSLAQSQRLWSSPSFFFFDCYAPHRDLHSFPTRRSSDLNGRALRASGERSSRYFPVMIAGMEYGSTRSEEHTSELQSRGHLVCRLLLEKKNQVRGARPRAVVRPLTDGAAVLHVLDVVRS